MRYSPERKEAILKKMAPPMSQAIPELAEQEGISTVGNPLQLAETGQSTRTGFAITIRHP